MKKVFMLLILKNIVKVAIKKSDFVLIAKKEILLINYNKHIDNNCDEVEINWR